MNNLDNYMKNEEKIEYTDELAVMDPYNDMIDIPEPEYDLSDEELKKINDLSKRVKKGELTNEELKDELESINPELKNELFDDKDEGSTYDDKDVKDFKALLTRYGNNIVKLFDEKIVDYKNNSENLFYGVLFALSTALGLSSQQININDDAGKGKTKFKEELFKIISNGYDIGSLSEKALYYINDSNIDRKIIYCNDKGLETPKQQEETEIVRGMIREAITDGKIIRQKVNNEKDGIDCLTTEIEAISLINTELHTKETYKSGEQFSSVTEIININPLSYDEFIDIQITMDDPDNQKKTAEFKELHKNYCQYLIDNYTDTQLTKATYRGITDAEYSHRENTRRIAYYRTYCHYFNYDPNSMATIKSWNQFYKHNNLPNNVLATFEVIKKYFTAIDISTFEGETFEHQLTRKPIKNDKGEFINPKTEKTLHFFTIDNIKSYLTQLNTRTGKLYLYRDNMNDILQQLVKHGYLGEISNGETRKIYYIQKQG